MARLTRRRCQSLSGITALGSSRGRDSLSSSSTISRTARAAVAYLWQ